MSRQSVSLVLDTSAETGGFYCRVQGKNYTWAHDIIRLVRDEMSPLFYRPDHDKKRKRYFQELLSTEFYWLLIATILFFLCSSLYLTSIDQAREILTSGLSRGELLSKDWREFIEVSYMLDFDLRERVSFDSIELFSMLSGNALSMIAFPTAVATAAAVVISYFRVQAIKFERRIIYMESDDLVNKLKWEDFFSTWIVPSAINVGTGTIFFLLSFLV